MRNEFAAVELSLDTRANAPRLHILDRETGASAQVDAFLLKSLCLLSADDLVEICRSIVPRDP